MSDTDQLLWRAYASHVQQLLLGDGILNHQQVILVSPPTQRGIAAGGTIPGTITNYLTNAIADNLFPVDSPVLASGANPRYTNVLKSYLTWVESGRDVAQGTKLRLISAHRDLTVAEEKFRQEEDSSIGRWQMSAQDNIPFVQWAIDNAQSYIEAKQRYKAAEGAFAAAAWGYYGPDSTTLLGYIERISTAKDVSSQNPGLNMPVTFADWREIERIKSGFEAPLAIYNLPAYSIQGLSSMVDEWVASFSSTENTTISISTATGATTSWSDLGFDNISGTPNVFSVTVDGFVKYLDISDKDGDIQIDLRYKKAQVFPVTAGIWDIPHVKRLFPKLRQDVPPVISADYGKVTSVLLAYGVSLKAQFGETAANEVNDLLQEARNSKGSASIFGFYVGGAGAPSEQTQSASFDDIQWDTSSGTLIIPAVDNGYPTLLGVLGERF